jgi:hypothetical protein
VYDYSKHSSQGNGNDDVSSLKACNIAAPDSSNKVENKLATIKENVAVSSGMLVPVQVNHLNSINHLIFSF